VSRVGGFRLALTWLTVAQELRASGAFSPGRPRYCQRSVASARSTAAASCPLARSTCVVRFGSVREAAWDEASKAHVARHAITPDEVEDVLFCRPRLVQAGLHGTTLTEAERRRFRRRVR